MRLNLKLVQIGRKAPPPLSFLPFGEILGSCHGTWQNFMHRYFTHHWTSHWWQLGRKAPTPGLGNNFLHWIYPFETISSNFGFCGRKATPPRMREFFFTLDLSISGNFKQLWFLWQKSSPPHPPIWGNNILHWIYPFQAISSNFGFCGRKAPPPQDEGNFFYTGSIHFRQFWATLVFVAEKPPPRMREIFLHWIYPFQAISSNFGFCGRKAPAPQDEGNFFTLDLSISGNFEQLWFLWQKSPPPWMREMFFTLDIYISGNFEQLWFLWQKSPPPLGWGNFFYTGSIHFRQFPASNFGFYGKRAPPHPTPYMREQYFTLDLSISGNFRQFPGSNFGFYGKRAPPHPTPYMREQYFTLDLSISGNFKQLWFLWQKSPTPPQDEGVYFTLDLSISGNFKQLWFLWQKSPTPPQDEGVYFTLDLSISGNFKQLWFLWQKSPTPPGWGKFFLHCIYPFQAILSNFGFCGRKDPSQDEGNFFYTGSIHFRQFQATLVFVAEKPPPRMSGKFFYTGSIHFRQFQATLVFVAEKPLPPRMREFFLHWIYPFQAILSNFGFCGRKAPPPLDEGNVFLHWIYPFQAILSNFGFCGRKAPPPGWGNFFYTGSIHFRQFPASNFGFYGRKAPPLWGNFFTLDLSISGNFQQLWFLWQRSPPITTRDERPLAG